MQKKIQIPWPLRVKIYCGLLLAIALLIGVYYLLYLLGGWILVGIGLVPYTLIYTLRSDPYGILVKRSEHPKLISLIEEIANEVNVAVPDEVYLTADTNISVSGIIKKRLTIGVAALRNLTEGEFRAIIAHEFGHFYGSDTIVGGVIWRIDNSMAQTSNFGKEWWDRTPLFEIAVIGGIITAFFEAFRFLFSAITYYYSRQLEYRADAVAAQVAGNTNFHNGLKKYSAFSDFFNTIGMNSIVSLLEEDRVYINIYEAAYTDYVRRDIRKIEKETIAADKWSMRSTHPTLARRLKRIAPSDKPANTSSAILLIGNHSDFEEFLTKELTNHIANQQWLQYEYDQALAREGRCRYCGEQYEKLNELLEHEEHCEHSRKQPRRRTTKRK